MFDGVLFDMDGVLFDTERPAVRACHMAAGRMGVEMSETLAIAFIGVTEQTMRELARTHFGAEFDGDAYYELARKTTLELIEKEGGLALMPGVAQTLDWLKRQGLKLCVASSSAREIVEENLAQGGVAQYFDRIVGGDMVRRGKPHPDIFLRAAETLGLVPGRCLAVEDSYNGVESAHAAGCLTVMVPDVLPPTPRMRELTAAVLGSLAELPEFVAQNRA